MGNMESETVSHSLCPALCDPMDCSPPGSPVHGIFQTRILEWFAISFSRASSQPRDRIRVFHTFRSDQIRLVAQSCPTLYDPMNCSPPGSSVHGIFQARVLEWVAISFSRDRTQVSCIASRHFTIWATRELVNFNTPLTSMDRWSKHIRPLRPHEFFKILYWRIFDLQRW